MSKKDNVMSVHVQEWRDRIVNSAYEGQRELTRLVDEFKGSGIGVPEKLADLTPEYVEGVVERGRTVYNGDNTFLPSAIRKGNDKAFDEILAKYLPIAAEVQRVIKQNPYTIRESDSGFIFDEKEVEDAANEKSLFVVNGEMAEYFDILQSLAQAMNKAKAWEREHGFTDWVGVDKLYFTTDGQAVSQGWATVMFDPEKKIFGITPERFMEGVLHGAMGKRGEI